MDLIPDRGLHGLGVALCSKLVGSKFTKVSGFEIRGFRVQYGGLTKTFPDCSCMRNMEEQYWYSCRPLQSVGMQTSPE